MTEQRKKILKETRLDFDIGSMIAIADEVNLYFLGFIDCRSLKRGMERLQKRANAVIVPGITPPLQLIEKELQQYFDGKLKAFKTSFLYLGSSFQKRVWDELQKIPFGETRAYVDVAKSIGEPLAFRAVANANGANQFTIIIPCHRVINANGDLGGYGGGIERKKWLLQHEAQIML